MRLGTMLILGALAAAVGATTAGCHHGDHKEARSPGEAMAELRDPNWETRRTAADHLGEVMAQPGPPQPDVLQALYGAAQSEQDPRVVGALIIALGDSGIPEARPLIDPRIADPNPDMRRWATRALAHWLVRNGLLDKTNGLPPPPSPLYGPPPPLPPNVPGSHPGLVGGGAPPPAGAAPAAPPGAAPPASPGPGPGGFI